MCAFLSGIHFAELVVLAYAFFCALSSASSFLQVLTIHLSNPAGDILIFMTGQEDIETTCEVLADRVSELEGVPPLLVLPMYSQVSYCSCLC
jgi:HrpA-like RNA helicase